MRGSHRSCFLTCPTRLLVRVRAQIRPPTLIPSGCAWVWEVLLDDVIKYSYTLIPGGLTHSRTATINLVNLAAGDHTLTIRLRFLHAAEGAVIAAADFECGP